MKEASSRPRFPSTPDALTEFTLLLPDAMKLAVMLLFAPSLAGAVPLWQWQQDGNRTLELRGAVGPIVRFVLDSAPRDPHFEILATPGGRNTVWVGPQDHVWHYGLWFSWKLINGVNFWETDPATGRQAGRSEILNPQIESTPDGPTATIRYRERAYPQSPGPAVLEDAVVIRITRPQDGRGPRVEWQVTTTALADVELGRTPLPAEPGGKPYGGYGGFSWRGAKDFKAVVFADSEGRKAMAVHRQNARWIDATGTLGDQPAGLILCDHPGNPGHPSSWYVAADNTPHGPFWFVNPALLQPKPRILKAGTSFTHRYQATVHDGGWQPADCEREAAEFASRPPLP